MSDRYRAVAGAVFVGVALAGLTVGGAAQQGGSRGQAPRTAQTPPPAIQWPAPPLPDGPIALLYALTEENDAALLRFEPGPAPAK